MWLSGLLMLREKQRQPVLQHCEHRRVKTTCSVKHSHSEKDAEKLEKTQKSSVHILRPEQKTQTSFKRGKTCYVLSSIQGKSSMREGSGELVLHKCMEKCPWLLSAVLWSCSLPASLEKSW